MTPDAFHISNIKPVLSNGVIYLLKNSWKLAIVPYGGNVVFTMIYPIISESKKIKKFASLAVITEGVVLSINSILFIGTLGVNFATRCNFPLLETYRIIDAGDFLTRLDIIFVLSFLVDGFFRISVFMYVAAVGASGILKLKNTKPVSIVLGIIMFIASFIISKSFTQQMYIGHNFIMRYIHFPVQVIIPILTLVVYNVRKNHVKKLKYPKKV
jgi:spore germination protein KB